MATLSDSDWEELAREVRTRLAAYAPDWTEPPGNDPGLTILELFAFLAENLLQRPDASPRLRRRARELLERLERSDPARCPDATLTRTRYFEGKLLTAADLQQDQEYVRSKQRRHNRLLHGVGIVTGLEVTLEPSEAGAEPVVHVSPGVAVGPDGEELFLCEPATATPCPPPGPCFVTLRLVEEEASPGGGGGAARIHEAAAVAVATAEALPSAALVIARLSHGEAGWETDRSFEPGRAGARNAP